jgi:FMN reductase
VLASPIHHNSFSGVLKNALDHLAIPQFRYKPVALLSHGGNRSTQAVDQLRIVARGLYAVAIPAQVCTSKQDFMETTQGYGLISEDIMERLVRLAGELMLFGNVLRELRIPACAIQ